MQTVREVLIWNISQDPLFVLIEIEPDIKSTFDRLIIAGRINFGLGIFSVFLMILSFFFYENAQHYIILGLLTSLTVLGFVSSNYGVNLRNRYFIYAQILLNIVFLAGILILLSTFTFIREFLT